MLNKLLEIYENIKKLDNNNKIIPFIILGIILSIVIILGLLSIIKGLFIDFNIRSVFGIILILSIIVFTINLVRDTYYESNNKK